MIIVKYKKNEKDCLLNLEAILFCVILRISKALAIKCPTFKKIELEIVKNYRK